MNNGWEVDEGVGLFFPAISEIEGDESLKGEGKAEEEKAAHE